MRQIILGVSILALISVKADAEVTVQEYREAKIHGGQSWDATKLYLLGVAHGVKYANGLLKAEHLPMLYCPPDSDALDTEGYLAILDRELRTQTLPSSMHIEVVLTVAMHKIYPCSKVLWNPT
jgi:hypothetical protein